jgi:hypothetical protein
MVNKLLPYGYSSGEAEVSMPDFLLEFTAIFEMEKADSGHLVCCQFVKFDEIKITPDSDVTKNVPYPALCSITGWVSEVDAAKALEKAMEDAEMRANEAIDNP